ncbi:MAG: hypothetical protein RIS70_2475, partial [Planctomycetota bacterium]
LHPNILPQQIPTKHVIRSPTDGVYPRLTLTEFLTIVTPPGIEPYGGAVNSHVAADG